MPGKVSRFDGDDNKKVRHGSSLNEAERGAPAILLSLHHIRPYRKTDTGGIKVACICATMRVFRSSAPSIRTLALTGLLWCLTSPSAAACYLIQTTGSGEYKTPAYWKEAGEIKFYMREGIVGLAESEVLRITKLTVPERPGCGRPAETAEDEPSEVGNATGGRVNDDEQDHAVATVTGPAIHSEAYRTFEAQVLSFEQELRRLDLLSREELFELAGRGQALRSQMLMNSDAQALTPLVNRVYEALERIESMIRP